MNINILTLFPDMFPGFLQNSIIGRAISRELVKVNVINIRDYAHDKHKTADDAPYGGGSGMVLKPEPIFSAFDELKKSPSFDKTSHLTVYVTPQGVPYTQQKAEGLARFDHLTILCGHYEGVDERVRSALIDEELSIGDYVLTGGELPALVVIDSVIRLLPGVLGDENSARNDSFSDKLLEHPHYTRPSSYRGIEVPEVLLSGDHKRIERWRKKESIRRTLKVRPELLTRESLSIEEQKLLEEVLEEEQD